MWTVTFPAVVAILTAGAFYDLAADSYALDVTPPEYHARVLGGISTAGQSIGSAMACVLPPLILAVGGYDLVLTVAGLTGLTSFLFLTAREPDLEHERVFSRRAVAFTFTERTVLVAALVMLARPFTLQKITAPLGGMFTFTVREVVSAEPGMVGTLGLAATLAGLPGSILGGFTADRWGHKRMFVASSIAFAGAGILWTTLSRGAVAWFLAVAMVSSFLERLWTGTGLALMADATPLALVYRLPDVHVIRLDREHPRIYPHRVPPRLQPLLHGAGHVRADVRGAYPRSHHAALRGGEGDEDLMEATDGLENFIIFMPHYEA